MEIPLAGTLANSTDPDEMQQSGAFNLCLHCLQIKANSGTEFAWIYS